MSIALDDQVDARGRYQKRSTHAVAIRFGEMTIDKSRCRQQRAKFGHVGNWQFYIKRLAVAGKIEIEPRHHAALRRCQ